ncbi:DUF58 domain-containing protein [Halobacterium salinarum]|nr:DUF58 domain-containing protein [Halobacterium salinarum]MDL0128292.1 DUF58 domain-containing protein [Halobacterium salinarum]
METTRRFWLTVGTIAVTGTLATTLQSTFLFAIPVGLGGWLVAHQLMFTLQVRSIYSESSHRTTIEPNPVLVDDSVAFTTTVEHPTLSEGAGSLKLSSVPGLVFDTTPVTSLSEGSDVVTLTATATPTVAGTYTLPAPTLTFNGSAGLFADSITIGDAETIAARSRVPRDIHVGEGGDRVGIAIGDHDATQGSAGFEPGELQEYTPGDPANRIDWRATARLQEPYIRDFEAETSRQTRLIIDNRGTMQAGQRGETKLDYVRDISLWLLEYANSVSDPVAATIVHDEDAWTSGHPTAVDHGYQRIRHRLQDLQPEKGSLQHSTAWSMTASMAQERKADLTGGDSFETTLTPYFADAAAYYQRVSEAPLFEITRREAAETDGGAWMAVITDDRHREELLETMQAVATENTRVAAFVLPSVLFSSAGLTDVSAAYEEYLEFEEFRQQLAATPYVTAYEVGPRDKLETVIQANKPRREDPQ